MKEKTIILSNAPIRNGNKGCVALCYSMMYLIDLIMSQKGIRYRLFLTDSGEKKGIHKISLGDKNIAYECVEDPLPAQRQEAYRLLTKMKEACCYLRLFRNADCIMDIGQGDSFADIYGAKRFWKIDKIHRVARWFKKPYIFLPQTIGPFKNEKLRTKAIRSMEGAKMVMVRDSQSLDYVKSLTSKAHVGEYIDVAFFLPYQKIEFCHDHIHVGLNISGLLWNGGYTKNNQFGLKADYPKAMRQAIDYFLSQPNVRLHLISHVASGERSVESDYAVEYDLWRAYHHERLVLAPLFHTPIEAKDYIAGLDFFMGARMHATIAAFSARVPVVSMAYSRKFNGLFVDTLHYDHLVDLKEDDEECIIGKVKKAFEHRTALHEEIAHSLATTVRELKEKLKNDLTTLLCK